MIEVLHGLKTRSAVSSLTRLADWACDVKLSFIYECCMATLRHPRQSICSCGTCTMLAYGRATELESIQHLFKQSIKPKLVAGLVMWRRPASSSDPGKEELFPNNFLKRGRVMKYIKTRSTPLLVYVHFMKRHGTNEEIMRCAPKRVLNDLKMLIFSTSHLVKRIPFFRLNNAGSVKRQDLI